MGWSSASHSAGVRERTDEQVRAFLPHPQWAGGSGARASPTGLLTRRMLDRRFARPFVAEHARSAAADSRTRI